MANESLQDQLWQTVLQTAGSLPIHPGCEGDLRTWIDHGVTRMESEGRVSSQDLEIARRNLEDFVNLMKAEASLRGHPEWLGEDSFGGALQNLDRRRTANAGFALWPFWPL
jgi:hypothetical protein